MSTSQQSSSGVRNLRAVFEQNPDTSISSPDRGRSSSATSFTSNGNSDKSPNPSFTRKIRANFVSVEPSGHLRCPSGKSPGDMENGNDITTQRRRESFSLSEEQDGEAIAELKSIMSEEVERRKNSIPALPEIVPEEAMFSNLPTPIPELNEGKDNAGQLGLWVSEKKNPPTVNGKSKHMEGMTSAAESHATFSEAASMKEQTAAVGEDTSLTESSFHGSIEPQSQPKKTPVKVNGTSRVNGSVTKASSAKSKPSGERLSLTAPTPSSKSSSPNTTAIQASKTNSKRTTGKGRQRSPMEKRINGMIDAQEKVKTRTTRLASQSKDSISPQTSTKSSIATPPSKSRPKSLTRPIAISSHLTAPTASSQAKHEHPTAAPSKESTTPSSKPIGTSSHLMAPTTASAAKHEQHYAASEKTRRTSTGKSTGLSSHLMAPTASSTAKHDAQLLGSASTASHPAAAADKSAKPMKSANRATSKSSTIAPKPTRKPSYSTRTSEPSNTTYVSGNSTGKRPESRTATSALASTSKRSAPPRPGFLDRMMRPTAVSTKRLAENAEHKAEVEKSPPRRGRAGSVKPNVVHGRKGIGATSRETDSKLKAGTGEEKAGLGVNGAKTKDEFVQKEYEAQEGHSNGRSKATTGTSVARPITPEVKKMQVPVTPEAKRANASGGINGLTNGDKGTAQLNGDHGEEGWDGQMPSSPDLARSPMSP